MDGDGKLTQTVLEQLCARLPHRTGTDDLEVVRRDELTNLSREILVEISKFQIDIVIHWIVSFLDQVSRPYENVPPRNRPVHLFATQTYILELLADCMTAHWDAVETKAVSSDRSLSTIFPSAPHMPNRLARRREPPPLEESQARYTLDCVFRLTAQPMAVEDGPSANTGKSGTQTDEVPVDSIMPKPSELDKYARRIIEYISASNWSLAYLTMQTKLKSYLRPPGQSDDLEASGLQFISHMSLNSKKLSLIIQELSQSFLALRKSTQNIIATVLPEAIYNWIDTNPRDFVELHSSQRRLEGGADVLFDIATQVQDNAKRRSILWPLQTALALLIPEVFWLAGMMGEAKSATTIAKKVFFLEHLRKSLRLPRFSEIAATCIVNICQAASYFPADSDSALLSFALDVQNEMREEIFKRPSAGISEDYVIDKDVMAKAFVCLCHLSIESVIKHLVPRCLEKNAPVSFKIALFAGAATLAQQANADDFAPLFTAIANDLREYFHAPSTTKAGGSINGTSITGSVDLLYQILELLKVRPLLLLEYSSGLQEDILSDPMQERTLVSLLRLITDEDEHVRKSAATFANRLLALDTLQAMTKLHRTLSTASVLVFFWKATSTIVAALSRKLLEFDYRDPGLKYMLDLIHGHLEARLNVLRSQKDLNEVLTEVQERNMANIALEVSFLVLLCSSDLETCSMTTQCLALLCEEGKSTENFQDLSTSNLTIMRNYQVYSEISLQSFRITGPVAFQKRLRKLLMKMSMPSPGILTAWEKIFGRWRTLCKQIIAPLIGKTEEEIQRLHTEWRNYTGFLASIGGCCIADLPHTVRADDTSLAGLLWIDRLASDGDPISLLERFMKQCLQLLICKHINVRENIREVLGTELNPRLYVHLFRSLETELLGLFDSQSKEMTSLETRVLFVEQAAGLLKTIVERLEETQDTFLSVDLGALTLTLARYLHGLKDDTTILRVKIKMCQLIELVAKKKEILNLRQEIRVRNSLLQILSEWMMRSSKSENGVVIRKDDHLRKDEVIKLQKDLDRACLKAHVNLLYRLPLQPSDTHHEADLVDAKSQMFCSYFGQFLSLLDSGQSDAEKKNDIQSLLLPRDDSSSIVELTIQALSNLLSANVDVGLKFSLEIGYHEDLGIRTAFMHVLTNILTQGTEFGALGDSAIGEKYEKLVDLLAENMDFVLALCEFCPSSEVDEMTIALLNIFDSRGKGLALLKGLIEQEVSNTESETELLRRNCVATKMLSVFAKWKGSDYLRKTLQEKLERLIVSSDRLDLELDPARTSSASELEHNEMQIQFLTKLFIDEITMSAEYVPESFRQICHTITNCVTKRFPEAKFTAVGAFIFLRFFCPAIVAPDSEGLVTSVPQKGMRRGLLLIAKIVQNLANNVLFGAKEPYMVPLNKFLTENIYQVTAFLREISNAPEEVEEEVAQEAFDFGSSVALHRFFFDHWEQVKQKLLFQEKSKRLRINGEKQQPESSIMIAVNLFSALIPTLGTPPLDISLGRPHISSQPSYSRFQHFMLRHSGRSVESILSARTVYDGGEAKDGTPVICFIMRNINVDIVDQDLFLYCFLKIASRMWHKPFAILVDATCYSMNNEFPDEFYRKMDSLMPPEVLHSLNRYYVYNMNSAYRKFFRRTLRHAVRDEMSYMHPKNVEFYLLGNLTELQQHFHLGSLHLPKETISLVTDSRFVFQPVTKLSKSKGKIEVMIKVGSQYIQITTVKKQDILPSLRMLAAVNDIFRLSDVEEANAALSQSGEKDVFGLKTDNGKVTSFFSSSKKHDILQNIKAAKLKQTKDNKPSKLNERTIRPEDVPGTLLNISLMNMASSDQYLRLSSYNLLCALCQAFYFNLENQLVMTKGLSIPADSTAFIVGVSEKLATSEPQLTFDFLTEFFVGWDKSPPQQRPLNILYMVPWLSNLKSQLLCAGDGENERGKERLAVIARKLIDLTIREPQYYTSFQQNAWSVISKEDGLLETFLDELVKAALSYGFRDERTETISSIAASFNTVTIRGKVIARLRKALNRTSIRATRHLDDNAIWNEICVLLRICLAISFNSRAQAQMFLPELFHIITLVANCGSLAIRSLVHSLLVNTVHSICTSFPLDESNLIKLKSILASLSEAKNYRLFSLDSATEPPERRQTENPSAMTEAITNLLLEIIEVAAPTTDMANIWRARWMSLVASTAFQTNMAIQPRAFAVMGCLAREDVDDDLLYQVLVALKNALKGYQQDGDSEMLTSIVTSLTKMMDNLPSNSRYLQQLFWLAMALVRGSSGFIFNCSAGLLEGVLRVLSNAGEFKDGKIVQVLLNGKIPVEEAAAAIDDLYGVRFDVEGFEFAVAASLLKGLQDPATKSTTLKTLSAFLEVTGINAYPPGVYLEPWPIYLPLIAARATNPDQLKEIFWMANFLFQADDSIPQSFDKSMGPNILALTDRRLFLVAVITTVDLIYCEEPNIQQLALRFFERVARERPDHFLCFYDLILPHVDEVLINSQNTALLRHSRDLMCAVSEINFTSRRAAKDTLSKVLDEYGFGGIWIATSLKKSKELEKRCMALTDKLIEFIIA